MYIAGSATVAKSPHWIFWAERGLVHAENRLTGHYQVYSVERAKERLQAIKDRIGYGRKLCAENKYYADQVRPEERFVEELEAVINKAIEQGTPSNPDAPAEYARRRPVTILVPDAATTAKLTRFRNTSE